MFVFEVAPNLWWGSGANLTLANMVPTWRANGLTYEHIMANMQPFWQAAAWPRQVWRCLGGGGTCGQIMQPGNNDFLCPIHGADERGERVAVFRVGHISNQDLVCGQPFSLPVCRRCGLSLENNQCPLHCRETTPVLIEVVPVAAL